jgi:hypothetical protein
MIAAVVKAGSWVRKVGHVGLRKKNGREFLRAKFNFTNQKGNLQIISIFHVFDQRKVVKIVPWRILKFSKM